MLSYKVFYENFNKKEIVNYDIFKSGHWEKVACELKEVFPNRKEWEKHFRTRLMSQYWSRSEYEFIATSWPPYITTDKVDEMKREIKEHTEKWGNPPYRINPPLIVARKIDIFEQIDMNWKVFADYVWRNI